MSSPSPLDYAPTPAQRWLISSRAILASVFAALVVSGWWWAAPAWRRMELLYWQHRCLEYQPSGNQVVYDPTSPASLHPPAAWSNFYSIYSPPGFRSAGTVFLHELQKPNGDRRLVVVDLDISGPAPTLVAYVRVFVPGSLFELPQETGISLAGGLSIDPSSQIDAGTPDPAQPSHFTFQARRGSVQTVYEGWLDDDDRVIIGQRKMPTLSK